MKKILLFMFMSLTLTFTSCVTSFEASAQEISYYDEYTYLGINYPVVYVNSVPYYYYRSQWLIIPTNCYHYIHHYRYPMTMRSVPPKYWRQESHSHHYHYDRPNYYEHRRPTPYSHDYKPRVVPNDRPNKPQGHSGGSYYHPNTNHNGSHQRGTPRGGSVNGGRPTSGRH